MSDDERQRPKILDDLDRLTEILPTPIYWSDLNCTVLGANQLVIEATGSQKNANYIGKNVYELYPYEMAHRIKTHNDEVIKTGKRLLQEESIETLDTGELRHYTAVKLPLRDDMDNIIGVIGTSIDITDKVNAENALKISRENEAQLRHAVTILAGSVAHDLRTPIASINLYTKLLTEEINTLATDKAKKLLSCLQNVTHDMNQNIDTTLQTISAAVKGSNEKQALTICDIGQCLNHVLDNYPFEDDEKNLVSWQNNHPFSFKGNAINFYRILFNLLKNALYQIDKQKKGEIIISTASEGDYNLLKFKDTAGGITEDMIKDIFSGFNTTKQGGTGVGLAFCQLAMQNMDGNIACHIVDRDCIEFVLSFPRVNDDE